MTILDQTHPSPRTVTEVFTLARSQGVNLPAGVEYGSPRRVFDAARERLLITAGEYDAARVAHGSRWNVAGD